MMELGWIDVHTHLNMLDTSPELALEEAKLAGVNHVITIGTGPDDWPLVREFGQRYFPRVACTLGVHPHDAKVWNPQVQKDLELGIQDRAVVAVGEIGLDYYYKNSGPEVQLQAFRAQMGVAERAKLPVEIHTREAEDDTIMVLNEFAGRVVGLLHCFTSSRRMAEAALALGYHISFSGVVTFKNAAELRETCAHVPLEKIHVETDAPFLAPVPFRGKKNRPAMVVHTAEVVAGLHGVSLERLAQVTRANASTLFPRWGI